MTRRNSKNNIFANIFLKYILKDVQEDYVFPKKYFDEHPSQQFLRVAEPNWIAMTPITPKSRINIIINSSSLTKIIAIYFRRSVLIL